MAKVNEKKGETQTENAGEPRKKNGNQYKAIAIVAVVIILIAGVVLFSNYKPEAKGNQSTVITIKNFNSTSVAIPLSSISQTATWYECDLNGSLVRFFVVEDSSGTVHTAFDECPICYPSHQGFRQENDMMVENCCNMGIAIGEITESGCSGMDCHPAYLATQVINDNVVISGSDLASGSYLFA